ncbi:MAG: hypothetical protein MK105_00145 [Crocinitomicaceae bacterium]|nr:hypothetical protein [Crocinitomicaceae bacterium]
MERGQNWESSISSRYPEIFYDECFKTTLELDSNLAAFDNIELYLGQYSDNLDGINWNIENQE